VPIEHPPPTPATVKELYANALRCAEPSCSEPLFTSRAGDVRRSLNSRMAHICAPRERGPRWDPNMTAEQNRSAQNLLLLCIKPASVIDLLENVAVYPVGLLREWKLRQLQEFDAAVGGWTLSDEEASEVIVLSVSMPVTLQADTVNFGGGGGNAPGAAGGGGAAIGPGALGGPGGSVGHIDLHGEAGALPGAGGGGGGTLAGDAMASRTPSGSDPTEGRGWSVGTDGQDGGDTTVSIGDEVLVRASGGRGGLVDTGGRLSSDRIRVSALLLVNYGEVHDDGLVSLIGGGWQNASVLNVPTRISLPLIVVLEAGGAPVGEYTVGIEVRSPDGSARGRVGFPVTVERAGDVCRIPRPCNVEAEVDAFGIWTVAVVTPERELARVELMVKRAGQA
jgi:hypothetical protein